MQIECNHKPSGTDPIYRVAMDKPKLFKKRSREKKMSTLVLSLLFLMITQIECLLTFY